MGAIAYRQMQTLLLAIALFAVPSLPCAAADADLLPRVLFAAENGRWSEVRALARRLSPPLAAYFEWRELLESQEQVPFAVIADFLERHPNWPEEAQLRQLAEGRMEDALPAGRVLRFFEQFPPRTARGRLVLARALRASGREAEARQAFAEAFREVNLSAEDLRIVEARFGDWLSPDLIAARVDRLLWQGRLTEARHLLDRLDEGQRRLALARIALQTSAPDVEAAIRRVPVQLRNQPGLVFDRLQWRLAKNQRQGVDQILLTPPAELGEPARWWQIRHAEVRRALAEGDVQHAVRLAQRHGQPQDAPTFVEAEWLAGWLTLRFARKPAEALARFERIHALAVSAVSRARAAYWAGRAAEALGRHNTAHEWYRRAAQHPTTFYGQLAADRAQLPLHFASGRIRLAELEGAGPRAGRFDADDERLQVARALCRLERDQHADDFFLAVAAQVDKLGAAQLLAEVRACGRAQLYVVVAKRLSGRGLVDPLQSFPLLDPAYLGEADDGVDPAFVIALARQESHFAPHAVSRAGARGITQILPSTAREIAARAGLPFSMRQLEEDPYYQIALARLHLARLFALYDGSLELVAAAYNAGTGRVRQWIASFGDPRRMSEDERIDWIERLPFAETRNYVQRVLEGYRVYRWLLENADGHPILPTGARPLSLPAPQPRPKAGGT